MSSRVDEHLHKVLITAGRTLAMRFNPNGRYLRSFVAPESLFIDIMMNVPIIFYAARETGDRALYDLAVAHCRTTERTIVRPDGGTAHEGIFKPGHRRIPPRVDPPGPQTRLRLELAVSPGPSTDSARSSLTRTTPPTSPLPVETPTISSPRLPDNFVPPLGFRRSGRPRSDRRYLRRAPIAASGLWNLAELTGSERYRDAARNILGALLTDDYVAWNTPAWEGILKHGVYHFHKKLGRG